jgi:hypothetical protein
MIAQFYRLAGPNTTGVPGAPPRASPSDVNPASVWATKPHGRVTGLERLVDHAEEFVCERFKVDLGP